MRPPPRPPETHEGDRGVMSVQQILLHIVNEIIMYIVNVFSLIASLGITSTQQFQQSDVEFENKPLISKCS